MRVVDACGVAATATKTVPVFDWVPCEPLPVAGITWNRPCPPTQPRAFGSKAHGASAHGVTGVDSYPTSTLRTLGRHVGAGLFRWAFQQSWVPE